ncbi:MAG TPA: chemotaxis protein CheW [Longimicrobiaceae bacterium]|nr:chemotaxis protein CheW [Longimicrobiaceae bacterium]
MSAPDPRLPAAGGAEEAAFRGVVFLLGCELYACDVRLVEEVVTGERVHPLPDLPRPLLGVVRLRGSLVPVLDLAPGLGLRLESDAPDVLVLDAGERRIGVAVDEAREVAAFPAEAVRPAPRRGTEQEEHVLGVARAGDSLVTLLDLAAVLENFTHLSTREPS